MSLIPRRNFLATAAAAATAAALPGNLISQPAGRKLRVQFSPGGHTAPLQIYAMFEDPLFKGLDTYIRPHPNTFDLVTTTNYPDVIVTNDWLTDQWPQKDRDFMVKHLEAGRGLVVLHHAVGTNDAWEWWTEQVLGCHLYDTQDPGMQTQARLKQFPIQVLTPIGSHPIVRGMTPFELPWDETFPNMWISPNAEVIFKTDDVSFRNPAVGWIGPKLPKGRVACFSPGHTRYVCQDPNFRAVVHKMILWTGGRLA